MPAYFVKQPNGLLARFSTVVDHFTHMNLSTADARDLACDFYGRQSQQEATSAVARALSDDIAYYDSDTPRRGDGLTRWHACIAVVRTLHGEAEYTEILERGTGALLP